MTHAPAHSSLRHVTYIHDVCMPSSQASTVNVAKMCAAFMEAGTACKLIMPKGPGAAKTCDQLVDFYQLRQAFDLCRVPLLGFPGGQRLFAWIAALLTIVFSKSRLAYGRKPRLLLPFARLGMPVAIELHTPISKEAPRDYDAFRKLISSGRLLSVITISKSLADETVDVFPELNGLITVAHDGADKVSPEAVTETADVPGMRNDVLRAGYAGHLYPGKGMELIAALAEKRPDTDFLIVGGRPDDVSQWRERTASLTNIAFVGHVPHAKVKAYIATCDVVLAPYQKKVLVVDGKTDVARWMSPLKLFEYMALGKAIIASDLPVIREIIENGRTGLLLDPEDIDLWSDTLASLGDKTVGLGEAAKASFEQLFTWDARIQRIQKGLLQQLG